MRTSRIAVTAIALASVFVLSACSSNGGSELPDELASSAAASSTPEPTAQFEPPTSSDAPLVPVSNVRGWLVPDGKASCPDGSEPLVTKERTTPENVAGDITEFLVCPPLNPDTVNSRGTVLDRSMPLFPPLLEALSATTEPTDPAVDCPTVDVYHLIYATNDAGEVWEVDVPRDKCGFPQEAVTNVVVYALPPTR